MRHIAFFLFIQVMLFMPIGAAQEKKQPTSSSTGIVHVDGSARLTVNDPRPMEKTITGVGQEYGIVIDYEDPIYQASALIDDTDPQWRLDHPTAKPVTRPWGGFFSTSYPDALAMPDKQQELLDKIQTDYNTNRVSGRFRLVNEATSRFAMVPDSRTPLDLSVQLSAGKRNLAEAVFALANAISASSGAKVVVGTFPLGISRQCAYTDDGKPGIARDKLAGMLSSSPVPLIYRLLYDADSAQYFLNYAVARQVWTNANGDRILTTLHQH